MQGRKVSHICNLWGNFLPVLAICTTTDTISILYCVGAMYLQVRTFCTLADTTFIPMGAMYLHARTFCTLADMTFIPMGTMYLHGRTFYALADMTIIPVNAMYLHARMFCYILM